MHQAAEPALQLPELSDLLGDVGQLAPRRPAGAARNPPASTFLDAQLVRSGPYVQNVTHDRCRQLRRGGPRG